jgi:HD-GYP domain-containing protein (c-di-GMP phosphodiesterase class II)
LHGLQPLAKILPIVLHHHEAWNGAGYPARLAGEQIPLLARIAAVADAFDAMSSDRPYRPGLPAEKIDAIFREGAGVQWDAEVVAAYFACRERIEQTIRDVDGSTVTIDPLAWVN